MKKLRECSFEFIKEQEKKIDETNLSSWHKFELKEDLFQYCQKLKTKTKDKK